MIDVRNPGDGFGSLRARVSALGPPAASDRGGDGAPLTVGEWALLIDDMIAHPQDNTEGLWNVATPDEDGREYDAIFVGGGAGGRVGSAVLLAPGGGQAGSARRSCGPGAGPSSPSTRGPSSAGRARTRPASRITCSPNARASSTRPR